ncbi:exported hypothetical protein [Candidatus Zixiibacteriota bacterium]|nr:exported hypothetical protein [candidate division Zixibacteria bacterium]
MAGEDFILRKISSILSAFCMLASAAATAMTIEVTAPQYACNRISPGDAGSPVIFSVVMDNNDLTRTQMILPLRIYSPDGSITQIHHINRGWYGSTQSINLFNGFEPSGFWDLTNQINEFSWDGNLPDTFCFTGAGSTGWPAGLGKKTYIQFAVSIDLTPGSEGYICIDTASPGPPYNWLFEDPAPVFHPDQGLPYCWYVSVPPDMDLVLFDNCAFGGIYYVDYGKSLNHHIGAHSLYGDPINYRIISGPGSIDQSSGLYSFTPACDDYGENYTVVIGARSSCVANIQGYCDFDIYVKPTMYPCEGCGDVKQDNALNILDVSYLINFLYKDGPPPPSYYKADVDNSGAVNILDVSRIINFIYKGGQYLICGSIENALPHKEGSWWQYERFDSLQMKYDTIMISAIDSNHIHYDLNNRSFTYMVETRGDTVNLGYEATPPAEKYIFPLIAGNSWTYDDGYFMKMYNVIGHDGITTPAGSFPNAYILTAQWGCGYECAGNGKEWFAPGIGKIVNIRQEFDLMDGWYTNEVWTLIAYFIAP